MIVGVVVWLVYSIIALSEISDKSVRNDYCGSLLWRYLLTTTILVGLSHLNAKQYTEKKDQIQQVICNGVCLLSLYIGLATWGTYELWGRQCDNSLDELSIYTMSYIITVYEWIISGIIVLGMVIFCVNSCCCSKKQLTNNDENYLGV